MERWLSLRLDFRVTVLFSGIFFSYVYISAKLEREESVERDAESGVSGKWPIALLSKGPL